MLNKEISLSVLTKLRTDFAAHYYYYYYQGWHGTFYPLGKTGWVKLGESG